MIIQRVINKDSLEIWLCKTYEVFRNSPKTNLNQRIENFELFLEYIYSKFIIFLIKFDN